MCEPKNEGTVQFIKTINKNGEGRGVNQELKVLLYLKKITGGVRGVSGRAWRGEGFQWGEMSTNNLLRLKE